VRISIEDDAERGRYVARADDRRAGELTYRRTEGRIALDHTGVREDFEGEGVGSALARRALDDAREAGVEVLPFCSFVRSYIERHPDYVDLVPEDQRDRFGLSGDQPS
jgi:predicted GNAT family acetyltransferase